MSGGYLQIQIIQNVRYMDVINLSTRSNGCYAKHMIVSNGGRRIENNI